MSFADVEMFFFLPAAIVLYWLLPRRAPVQNAFLLLASWLFYAAWDWRWLPLLWAGTLVDFGAALWIERNRAPGALARRRLALALSLAWNLGALGYFKYSNFFLDSGARLAGAFGFEVSVPVLSLVLPLGISFYTLQRLSYVFDVYLGREPACRSLLNFALYAGYFPQLTAGPIARAAELLSQLAAPRRLGADWLARGAGAFLLGYALKAWLGDSIGPLLVDPVFAQPGEYTAALHWLALAGYAIQVFADFAGYSLMAIGCSRCFAIELPVNFNAPFVSSSLPELWRRWHISLNRWLFDYIYGPLTTGRSWLRGRFDVVLLLTFLASGLWHGAALTFLAWGLIHGLGMVAQRRWDEWYRGRCRADRRFVAWRRSAPYVALAWLLTQAVFLLSLVPFRAQDFAQARRFAHGLVAGGARTLDLWIVDSANLLAGFALVAAMHLASLPRFEPWWRRFLAWPAPLRGAVYGCGIAYLLIFVPVSAGNFIYQQF